MIPSSWRGHAVIKGLVELATEALPDDVRVIDGPAPNKVSEKELLLIGWAPFIDRHAVARREEEDVCGRMTEEGEIACYIAIRHGNNAVGPVRERAAEILTLLEQAIRADRTGLGGAADEVSIGNSTLTQHKPPNEGGQVGLSFAVEYRAYI